MWVMANTSCLFIGEFQVFRVYLGRVWVTFLWGNFLFIFRLIYKPDFSHKLSLWGHSNSQFSAQSETSSPFQQQLQVAPLCARAARELWAAASGGGRGHFNTSPVRRNAVHAVSASELRPPSRTRCSAEVAAPNAPRIAARKLRLLLLCSR